MTEAVLPTPYPLDYLRLGLLVTCSVSLLCTCQGTQHRGHGGISTPAAPHPAFWGALYCMLSGLLLVCLKSMVDPYPTFQITLD